MVYFVAKYVLFCQISFSNETILFNICYLLIGIEINEKKTTSKYYRDMLFIIKRKK